MIRPLTIAILAMTADGKIADRNRQAARFGSPADQKHLEQRIAAVDAVMLGAGTLRAYRRSLSVRDPQLLSQRHAQGKPPQPIQMICSASGNLDPNWHFFYQPFPRWLITVSEDPSKSPLKKGTADQGAWWYSGISPPIFEKILQAPTLPHTSQIAWGILGQQLWDQGIRSLGILGGGTLLASLLDQKAIDELYLTLCPLILGGANAPTLVDGFGFLQSEAIVLTLCQSTIVENEVFLHYRVHYQY